MNIVIFGSKELQNYNERLEKEVEERQLMNLYLKTIKQNINNEQKSKSFTNLSSLFQNFISAAVCLKTQKKLNLVDKNFEFFVVFMQFRN